jgi:KRAB domain-containing zinc finger protein
MNVQNDLIIPFTEYEQEIENDDRHLFDMLTQMEGFPMREDPHLYDVLSDYDNNDNEMDDAFYNQLMKYDDVPRSEIRCDECQITFKSKRGLKVHMKSKHTDLLKIQCPKCFKIFSKYYLPQHLRTIHKTEYTFPCEFCDNVFTNQSDYFEHKRQHITQCPVCGEDLSRLNVSLTNIHLNNCRGIRFECPYPNCDASYTNQPDLTRHYKDTHTMIQQLNCDQCNFTTTNKSSFRNHIYRQHTVHPIESRTCYTCDIVFSTPYDFKRHKKKYHD